MHSTWHWSSFPNENINKLIHTHTLAHCTYYTILHSQLLHIVCAFECVSVGRPTVVWLSCTAMHNAASVAATTTQRNATPRHLNMQQASISSEMGQSQPNKNKRRLWRRIGNVVVVVVVIEADSWLMLFVSVIIVIVFCCCWSESANEIEWMNALQKRFTNAFARLPAWLFGGAERERGYLLQRVW